MVLVLNVAVGDQAKLFHFLVFASVVESAQQTRVKGGFKGLHTSRDLPLPFTHFDGYRCKLESCTINLKTLRKLDVEPFTLGLQPRYAWNSDPSRKRL